MAIFLVAGKFFVNLYFPYKPSVIFLFLCSWTHLPPIHDPDSANYVCGSNLLNISLETLAAAVTFVAVIAAVGYWRHWRQQRQHEEKQQQQKKGVGVGDDILRGGVGSSAESFNRSRMTLRQVLFQVDLVHVLANLISWKHTADNVSRNHPLYQQQLCNPVNSFQLCMFVNTLRKLRLVGITVGLLVIIVSCPLFAFLKLQYGTYDNQYNWRISAAFLSGVEPGTCILAYWVVLICAVYLLLGLRSPLRQRIDSSIITVSGLASSVLKGVGLGMGVGPRSTEDLGSSERGMTSAFTTGRSLTNPEASMTTRRSTQILGKWDPTTWTSQKILAYCNLGFFFVVNVIVVITLKSIFIYGLLSSNTSFSVKVLLEAFLSSFDLLWGYGIVPYIVFRVPRSSMSNRLFLKVILLYFNSIVAPIIAIILTDASCFQGLFVKNSSVSINYQIVYCYFYGLFPGPNDEACELSASYVTESTFTPTFYYNYDCYSAVLTNYSPVFLFSYCFLGFISPIIVCVLIGCCDDPSIKSYFPRIYWLAMEDEENVLPDEDVDRATSSSSPSAVNSRANSVVPQPSAAPFGQKRVTFKDNIEVDEGTDDGDGACAGNVLAEDGFAVGARINSSNGHGRGNSADDRARSGSSTTSSSQAKKNVVLRNAVFMCWKIVSLCSADNSCWDFEDNRQTITAATPFPKNKLFQADRVVASILHHLLVLLTFGALVPELGAMAALVMVVATLQWEVLIGRYLDLSPECVSYRASALLRGAPGASTSSTQSLLGNSLASQGLQLGKLAVVNPQQSNLSTLMEKNSNSLGINLSESDVEVPEVGEALMAAAMNPLFERAVTADANRMSSVDSAAASRSSQPSFASASLIGGSEDGARKLSDPSGGLDACCGKIYKGPSKITWLLIYCSAAFYALCLVDMVGDSKGWKNALPFFWAALFIPAVLWGLFEVIHVCSSRCGNRSSADEPASRSVTNNGTSTSVTASVDSSRLISSNSDFATDAHL
jgi:hypothetical protein